MNKKLILILLSVFTLKYFVLEFNYVKGKSMLPNYREGDFLLSLKSFQEYKKGDVVFVNKNNTVFIKRIIGTPNDKIKIENNSIFLNENKVNTNYIDKDIFLEENYKIKKNKSYKKMNEVILKENEYFVMGDNRSNSYDSRMFGSININEIRGKAVKKMFNYRIE